MKSEVLFICRNNFSISRFAEIYFNVAAEKSKLNWTAISKGWRIDQSDQNRRMDPNIMVYLSKKGIFSADIPEMPRQLILPDLMLADLIVTFHASIYNRLMNENREFLSKKLIFWGSAVQALNLQLEQYNQLEKKLDNLVNALAKNTMVSNPGHFRTMNVNKAV